MTALTAVAQALKNQTRVAQMLSIAMEALDKIGSNYQGCRMCGYPQVAKEARAKIAKLALKEAGHEQNNHD